MTNMKNLDRLKDLSDFNKSTTSAFWTYDQRALADGAIPKKYKELMAIAVALTTQCTYCIEIHRQAAIDAGATKEELAEAIHVAAALRAGAAITHGTHVLGEPIES
ncbi:MAG: carboxymuconolactone decarboxylase family protein [Verrucomicrobiota bacterium]